MSLKQTWRNIRPRILGPLIYNLVSLLGKTYKIETHGWRSFNANSKGKIIAGWHGRSLPGAIKFRDLGYFALISHSRDGEMQNIIFQSFGFQTIRGSTGRGGMQALVDCIRVLKKGATIAFTPDGPRGPSGIVQPGVLMMAKKSGAEIYPAAASADRRWLIKSWDRYMIPKPFAKISILIGTPISVPANASEEELESIRLSIEAQNHRLEKKAEAIYGHPEPTWHDPKAHFGP